MIMMQSVTSQHFLLISVMTILMMVMMQMIMMLVMMVMMSRWQQGAVEGGRGVSVAKDFPEISTLPVVIQVATQIILFIINITVITIITKMIIIIMISWYGNEASSKFPH